MTFGAPHLLWLALLAPAAAALGLWLWRRRLRADSAWAARSLWDRLLPGWSSRRIAVSVLLLALAVLGASLALARPRWGAGEQKVERKGVDVVFLIDSSLSMGARDVPPSRLYVAKSLVRRMARAMPGNRVGLVQTEGDGVMLSPLTLDGAVLDLLLDTIDPGSLPTPGTQLATGLDTALRVFGQGSEKHRALVVLSDGEDWGGGLDDAVGKLREAGVVVYALGVGTPDGAPVPLPGSLGETKRDADGNLVVTRLHADVLEKLARSTGGSYLKVTSAAADPAPLLRQIDRMEKRTIESMSLSTLKERFQWPLALAALALLLHLAVGPFRAVPSPRKRMGANLASERPLPRPSSPRPSSPAPSPPPSPGEEGAPTQQQKRFGQVPLSRGGGWGGRERGRGEGLRRGRSTVLPALLLIALPSLSIPWQSLVPDWVEHWLYNPRERVEQSLGAQQRGKPREAVEPADTALRLAPDDPTVQYDAGTARLGAGRGRQAVAPLEKAAKGAGRDLAPAANYNLGNARLAAGDAAGAAEAFKQALRLRPDDQDAKWNLELALREEQKQKMGGQGSPKGSRGNRSPNQDPSDQEGKKGKPDPNQKPEDQQGQQPQQQGGKPQDQQGQGGQGGQQLPQFKNQPEMSAQEAASVLAAVENLERQQRREQAAKRARQHAAKGKDW
ncbi:MAG TPA: VWA domain-containing protein [Thermoanaerobaculia bacterium]|nr:VWA domain-containing protein [Thermoanaerobaculia bacterium]